MNSRKNAYTEVYTILQDLDDEEYSKIPFQVLEVIRLNSNQDYKYKLYKNLPLKYQPMLPETKAILFNLFRDYISTPEQKEKIIKMQTEERRKIEIKKQQNFRYDNLFTNKNMIKNNIEQSEKNTALITIKKKNFLQRIIYRLKNFFNK